MNYKIIPTNNNRYKIDALIKRDGKQYRKRVTVIGKREARKRALEIVSELEVLATESLSASKCSLKTFGECVEYYIVHTPVNLNNCYHPLKILREHLYRVPLEDIQEHYDKFMYEMKNKISYMKRNYTAGTLNRFSQRIRAILNFCKKKKVISKNIELQVSMFKEIPRTRILSDEELERFLKVVKEQRKSIYPLIRYALQIPVRRNEILRMRREWVDITNRCVVIPPIEMKNRKQCIKPIPPNMVRYFENIPVESEFVFYWIDKGGYRPIKCFRGSWDYCLREAGISDFRFHDTRHHSATNLIKRGVSERVVMQVAGWSTNMLSTYFNNNGFQSSDIVSEALRVSP